MRERIESSSGRVMGICLFSNNVTMVSVSSVNNTLDPEWVKVFTFDYQLGSPAKLAVTLFDEVQKGENRSMGAAVFDVGTILGSRGGVKAKRVKGGGM
jgi:hypothetical protein